MYLKKNEFHGGDNVPDTNVLELPLFNLTITLCWVTAMSSFGFGSKGTRLRIGMGRREGK